jgi:hypothetical protein
MNEQIKNAIKQTMQTPGWVHILDILDEEFIDGKKATSFNTEGKTNEMIAREVTARELSAKAIKKAFDRLQRIANETDKPKQTIYK